MKCFLDLDGILIDFHGGWLKHHNRTLSEMKRGYYDWLKLTNMNVHEFWKGISDQFWIDLEWMADGKEILSIVEEFFNKENICLVTQSPPSAEYTHVGLSGKVQWIATHLPDYKNNFLIGPGRRFCSSPKTFLIDDNPANTNDFAQNGGTSILIPRYWNLSTETIAPVYLRQQLQKHFKG